MPCSSNWYRHRAHSRRPALFIIHHLSASRPLENFPGVCTFWRRPRRSRVWRLPEHGGKNGLLIRHRHSSRSSGGSAPWLSSRKFPRRWRGKTKLFGTPRHASCEAPSCRGQPKAERDFLAGEIERRLSRWPEAKAYKH